MIVSIWCELVAIRRGARMTDNVFCVAATITTAAHAGSTGTEQPEPESEPGRAESARTVWNNWTSFIALGCTYHPIMRRGDARTNDLDIGCISLRIYDARYGLMPGAYIPRFSLIYHHNNSRKPATSNNYTTRYRTVGKRDKIFIGNSKSPRQSNRLNCVRRSTYLRAVVFSCHDLELGPVTLKLDRNIDILEMYLRTENKVDRSSRLKVVAEISAKIALKVKNQGQRSTGFLQCFDAVGWVIWPVKIVPGMTYKVSSGTLNLCSINQSVKCHQLSTTSSVHRVSYSYEVRPTSTSNQWVSLFCADRRTHRQTDRRRQKKYLLAACAQLMTQKTQSWRMMQMLATRLIIMVFICIAARMLDYTISATQNSA